MFSLYFPDIVFVLFLFDFFCFTVCFLSVFFFFHKSHLHIVVVFSITFGNLTTSFGAFELKKFFQKYELNYFGSGDSMVFDGAS